MSTRSSARNLFLPLNNPELTIRRRSHADPTLLNDFEMAAEGNGDLPVPDLLTMEELCQPSLNGRGGPIALIAIQPMNFGLKNDMIQQVQNSCQFHEITALNAEMAEINKNLMRVLQVNQQVKAVTPNYETCGGPHSFTDCPATIDNSQNVYATGAYQGGNSYKPQGNRNILSYRSDNYLGPPVHEDEYRFIFRFENSPSTKDVQPPVVQTESPILNSEPIIAPIIEPVVAPVSASKPNQRPSIPYPSRLHDQKLRDKANDQREKFFQIFKDLNFNISFVDALTLMPKFGPSIKSDDANKHPDKFLHVTQSIKVNGVTDDALYL
nr:reverse transcriptase domain-containing protein [Tanacetum cinerariifolium]